MGSIILAGGWYLLAHRNTTAAVNSPAESQQKTTRMVPEPSAPTSAAQNQGASGGAENTANFKCDGAKTMTIVFTNNLAGVTLSDGRQFTLHQSISDSTIRYVSNDTKIEFDGKGSDGFLLENGKTTYANCVAN